LVGVIEQSSESKAVGVKSRNPATCAIWDKMGHVVPHLVRHDAAARCYPQKITAVHNMPSKDRRVQKTRALLADALGSLIHEKPYDDIVVKEILHRANVGRSTFYAHYRDKDELLSSAMRDLLHPAAGAAFARPHSERILGFSLPVLEHIAQRFAEGSQPSAIGLEARFALHNHLEQAIVRSIADEVRRRVRERGASVQIPAELLVKYVASTFTAVLEWWISGKRRLTPGEVDQFFRALVLPTLSQALD
jgi:AcrR family transcriptional regulator